MAKYTMVESYIYEIEADNPQQAREHFHQFLQADDETDLDFDAKFVDNQQDLFDENMKEVMD